MVIFIELLFLAFVVSERVSPGATNYGLYVGISRLERVDERVVRADAAIGDTASFSSRHSTRHCTAHVEHCIYVFYMLFDAILHWQTS